MVALFALLRPILVNASLSASVHEHTHTYIVIIIQILVFCIVFIGKENVRKTRRNKFNSSIGFHCYKGI